MAPTQNGKVLEVSPRNPGRRNSRRASSDRPPHQYNGPTEVLQENSQTLGTIQGVRDEYKIVILWDVITKKKLLGSGKQSTNGQSVRGKGAIGQHANSNPDKADSEVAKQLSPPFDGVVNFKGTLLNCMSPLWPPNEKTQDDTFIVWNLPPEAIAFNLTRQAKRDMLRELAKENQYPKRRIKIQSKELPDELTTANSLSHAAILIISVGLKGGRKYAAKQTNTAADRKHPEDFDPTRLFAELVGCAPATTMAEISKYLRYPLLELEELPNFIHCAVRQIARGKINRSPEPVKLVISTASAIAAALEHLKELPFPPLDDGSGSGGLETSPVATPNQTTKLRFLMSGTLKKADIEEGALLGCDDNKKKEIKLQYSRDLGCHTGLLLAGVQQFLSNARSDKKKQENMRNLFIDVSTGLLTGVPVGGFVFGAFGSVAKFALQRVSDANEKRLLKLCQEVKGSFDELIAGPIFFDGGFDLEGEPREADWQEFSKWYERVIDWVRLLE